MYNSLFRKGLVIWIILLFILFGVFPSYGMQIEKNPIIKTKFGNILYVGGNGPGNYSTIQGAIENASDGDKIIVFYGTYNEAISLDKELTLIGIENQDGDLPLINNENSNTIVIRKDNCTIQNFEVRSEEDAITLKSNYNQILNCLVTDAVKDLHLLSSCHNKILNNEFRGGWIGIRSINSSYNLYRGNNVHHHNNAELNLDGNSNNNEVYYNNFSYSKLVPGIMNLRGSSNNVFYYNIIKNNLHGGIRIGEGTNLTFVGNQMFNNSFTFNYETVSLSQLLSLTIENNTINSRPVYFKKNEAGLTVPSNVGQVVLASCSNSNIRELNITHADFPILLISCNDIDISNNYLSSKYSFGIYVKNSNNIKISNNDISRHANPVMLQNSNDNIISDNSIYGSGNYGMNLRECLRNQILSNEISQRDYGIDLWDFSKNNIVSQNIIRDSGKYAIICFEDSVNNEISNNIIESSKRGIAIRSSICKIQGNKVDRCTENALSLGGFYNVVEGNTFSNSSLGIELSEGLAIVIKKNNFINNDLNAYFENCIRTKWRQNYWSDHGFGPYFIKGRFYHTLDWPQGSETFELPWINIDIFPAKEPYDI